MADNTAMTRFTALRLLAPCLLAASLFTQLPSARAQNPPPSAAAIADYEARLAQYQAARSVYDADATAYWDTVAAKRRARNAKRRDHIAIGADDYVLTQPPIYAGPP